MTTPSKPRQVVRRPPAQRRALIARLLPWAVAIGVIVLLAGMMLPSLGSPRRYAYERTSSAAADEVEVPPLRVQSIPAPSAAAPAPMSVRELRDSDAIDNQLDLPKESVLGESDNTPLAGNGRRRGVGKPQGSVGRTAPPDVLQGLPVEVVSGDNESPIPKGREEAVADSEMGGQGAFMAIGEGRRTESDTWQRQASGGGLLGGDREKKTDVKDAVRSAMPSPTVEKSAKPAGPRLPLLPALAPPALARQLGRQPPLLHAFPVLRLDQLIQTCALPIVVPDEALQRLQRSESLSAAPGLTAGEHLLLLAHRAGLQLIPVGGRLELNPVPTPLDPTDRLGLTAPEFAAAFGTPAMALVAHDAQHTFALDADTASFNQARSQLAAGRLPDPALIRPEHFVNAVPGDYPRPTGGEAFALYAEAGPSPFAAGPLAARTALVAVGVVGRAPEAGERKALRLVLALDASGSMARSGAWDRARLALDGLIARLDGTDRVAVVAFGDRARVVLPATDGAQGRILTSALDSVVPDGSTNTAEGLALACQVARELAEPGTSLRVVLVSDGATIAGPEAAAARERAAALRAAGGSLLVLGVGERAPDPRALEELVTAGDGQQLFLGDDDEAQRVVEGALLPARLTVLARDAKAQVTWNPGRVTHARLIGYERRRLSHASFRDDRVDAGELSAAAVVTALFEVVLADGGSGPLGEAAVRYHDTRLDAVRELACPMPGAILAPVASPRLRTLAAAAELAEQLRASWWANLRPLPFRRIAEVCTGLPPPADQLVEMATMAERLRPLPEVRK